MLSEDLRKLVHSPTPEQDPRQLSRIVRAKQFVKAQKAPAPAAPAEEPAATEEPPPAS